jgi:hypothetical protein
VIRSAIEDRGHRENLVRLNPFLRRPGLVEDAADRIEHNRRVVLDRYALGIYRRRLLDIYHRVVASTVRHSVDKTVVLSAFLAPERFSLLKWCPYDSTG